MFRWSFLRVMGGLHILSWETTKTKILLSAIREIHVSQHYGVPIEDPLKPTVHCCLGGSLFARLYVVEIPCKAGIESTMQGLTSFLSTFGVVDFLSFSN